MQPSLKMHLTASKSAHACAPTFILVKPAGNLCQTFDCCAPFYFPPVRRFGYKHAREELECNDLGLPAIGRDVEAEELFIFNELSDQPDQT